MKNATHPAPEALSPGELARLESATQRKSFGQRLRQIRREKGLTLHQCADLSGVAISTLSKAERGLMSLTYDRLTQIAVGLGLDLGALLGSKGSSFNRGSVSVARKGDFQLQETPNYSYEILFPDLWHKAMVPMTGVVKARSKAEFEAPIRHPGQEFVHVLSGELTVHIEGQAPIVLSQGESLYFDSSLGHVYTSSGEQLARILVVCLG